MITHLALHDATQRQLMQFLRGPSHAVLIAGPDGIGKTAIARAIMSQLLDVPLDKLATYPYIMQVAPAGDSISIETIRELGRFLQLKTAGTHPYRRAVLIEHAQKLTKEAQNAYLKLLEEPPADTLLLLTANSPRALLPTIMSRVQTITVHPPTQATLTPFLAERGKDQTAVTQAYFLSGGLPGLLMALLSDDATHPLTAQVAAAKELLQKPTFDRLAMTDTLSKQKETARGVVEALERIAQVGLSGATAKNDTARLTQWHNIRKQTLEAKQSLERSVNAKLVLTNLFLNLG